MQLSFIVPVYNVSSYLVKCLDSLLEQGLGEKDYEIIVVDDGSTDDSVLIAQEYADRHPNIVLVRQKNQGLSVARNVGINIACGKYLQFVDPDDYLNPKVEKELLEKMEKDHLDVLGFGHRKVNERYEVLDLKYALRSFATHPDGICEGKYFLDRYMGYAAYVWQFMVKTELVRSIPLFKEGIYYEDVEWTPRMLVAAGRIALTRTVIYNYVLRSGSITRATDTEKKKKKVVDRMWLVKELKENVLADPENRWHSGMLAEMVILLMGDVAADFYAERGQYIRRLKHLKVFPLDDYHLSSYELKKRRLLNFSPRLFCLLKHLRVKNRFYFFG